MFAEIQQEIIGFLKQLEPDLGQPELVRPPNWEMGHLGVPLFVLAKQRKQNPAQLAKDLEAKCQKKSALPPIVERVQAVGPYINFFLNWDVIVKDVQTSTRLGALFAAKRVKESIRPVLIEYSSPNLAKPLGFHHLRGTMLGQVLCNIHIFSGIPVIRYNYLGDMGTGFGKLCVGTELLFGKGWEKRKYTIADLYKAYVKFQGLEEDPKSRLKAADWALRLEHKDKSITGFHDEVLRVTKAAFEVSYGTLGVHFDVWDGEFNYANQNDELIDWLDKIPGVTVGTSEGAHVLFFEEDVLPSLILIKTDGSSVYLARDILSAKHRLKMYKPSKLVYVVGSEQTLHLKQLKYILDKGELFREEEGRIPQLQHVPYGLMSIQGLKMSTRKGTVLLLEDVIHEATEEMKMRMGQKTAIENIDEKARVMATGAIIFSDISHTMTKNVNFRWDDILNVEGDTGPYVYYAYARLSGILRKMNLNREDVVVPKIIKLPKDAKIIHQLLLELTQFHWISDKVVAAYDPSLFARYLLNLAKMSNAFYHAFPIKDEKDKNIQKSLLWLLVTIQDALRTGAKLLNMELLEAL